MMHQCAPQSECFIPLKKFKAFFDEESSFAQIA